VPVEEERRRLRGLPGRAGCCRYRSRIDGRGLGVSCMLEIEHIPGGEVIRVAIASPCNADPSMRS
jgi:hypothetical protein